MDAQFLDELQEIIGCQKFSLPLVFIGGRYIGGAEEIRQLHENGELKKLDSLYVNGVMGATRCTKRKWGSGAARFAM